MNTLLRKALRKPTAADTVFLVKDGKDLANLDLTNDEINYVKRQHRNNHNVVCVNRYKNMLIVVFGEFIGTRSGRMET